MATLLEKCNNIKNDKELNLKPENLKEGITCLGVTGTLKEGIDTSDATATAYDIVAGTSAYINGEKIEGLVERTNLVATSDVGYDEGANEVCNNIIMTTNEAGVLISEAGCVRSDGSMVADAIGLTSDKIMSGNTILGVYGTATEDTDATSDDLLEMKTAYSQGQRIYGTIGNWRGTPIPVSTDNVRAEENDIYVEIHPEVQATGYNSLAIDNGCGMQVMIPNYEVAESINLIPDMIVEGNRVLGIDGTARLGYDTSDADATSDNIEPGYSAYTRDGLVHGSMSVAEGLTIDSEHEKESPEYRLFYDAETNKVQQIYRNTYKTLILEGTEMDVRFAGEDIAEVAGITPDKIVEGNTILGVPGSATVGADGPLQYVSLSDGTQVAIQNYFGTDHFDALYRDGSFLEALFSDKTSYDEVFAANNTFITEGVFYDYLTSIGTILQEKIYNTFGEDYEMHDNLFNLNSWYKSICTASYSDENGAYIDQGAFMVIDYHMAWAYSFVMSGEEGIYVTDVHPILVQEYIQMSENEIRNLSLGKWGYRDVTDSSENLLGIKAKIVAFEYENNRINIALIMKNMENSNFSIDTPSGMNFKLSFHNSMWNELLVFNQEQIDLTPIYQLEEQAIYTFELPLGTEEIDKVKGTSIFKVQMDISYLGGGAGGE